MKKRKFLEKNKYLWKTTKKKYDDYNSHLRETVFGYQSFSDKKNKRKIIIRRQNLKEKPLDDHIGFKRARDLLIFDRTIDKIKVGIEEDK